MRSVRVSWQGIFKLFFLAASVWVPLAGEAADDPRGNPESPSHVGSPAQEKPPSVSTGNQLRLAAFESLTAREQLFKILDLVFPEEIYIGEKSGLDCLFSLRRTSESVALQVNGFSQEAPTGVVASFSRFPEEKPSDSISFQERLKQVTYKVSFFDTYLREDVQITFRLSNVQKMPKQGILSVEGPVHSPYLEVIRTNRSGGQKRGEAICPIGRSAPSAKRNP